MTFSELVDMIIRNCKQVLANPKTCKSDRREMLRIIERMEAIKK